MKLPAARAALPAHVVKALDSILDSGWEEERESAGFMLEDNDEDPACLENHIFSSLVVVDNWLNGRDVRPEEHIWTKDDEHDGN